MPIIDEGHQEIVRDCSIEYNIINSESFKAGGHEYELVKVIHKVDIDQTFYGDDKGPYFIEEEKKIENARKKFEDQDQFSEAMPLQTRQEGCLQQDTRRNS